MFCILISPQKTWERSPVPNWARFCARHSSWCCPLSPAKKRSQQTDDWRISGQSTKTVQPRCVRVSILCGEEVSVFQSSRCFIMLEEVLHWMFGPSLWILFWRRVKLDSKDWKWKREYKWIFISLLSSWAIVSFIDPERFISSVVMYIYSKFML